MIDLRSHLVDEFNGESLDHLPDLISLNQWQLKKCPLNSTVAGVLSTHDSLAYLVGHNHKLLLENFTLSRTILVGGASNYKFTVNDLRDGDKIAVTLSKNKIDKIWLISLNKTNNNLFTYDYQKKWKNEQKWSEFKSKIEFFFKTQKFYQAQTPQLVVCPGLEPTLDPFSVKLIDQNLNQKLFLPTSPELHLKKIISQGVSEIFEITSCFRNNEFSKLHQPEFTMLEWYRSYKGLDNIISDIKRLIKFLLPNVIQPNYKKISVQELFKKYVDFDLRPNSNQKDLYSLAKKLNIRVDSNDSFNDIFFLIFIEKIENQLGATGIDFVCDYPPSQAALAKINKNGWADRFEMYWKGYEIANAFNELTCPKTQRQRFVEDQSLRKESGKEFIPIDEDFLTSLNYGLPPTAGIAMGLERLFMACYGVEDIRHLKQFPFLSN